MTWRLVFDRFRLVAFKLLVRSATITGAYGVLAWLCGRYVEQVVCGVKRPLDSKPIPRDVTTVLVLDYERFRGDIDIFSGVPDIRILVVSWNLLRSLLRSFVMLPSDSEVAQLPKDTTARIEFHRAGTRTARQRERYRVFLRHFLPKFFGGLNIDIVMNSDFRYRREVDLVRIASECGYGHICYYREALYIVPAHYTLAVQRHRAFAPFYGDLIAVQNDVTKRMFLESGISTPDRIRVRGCPRMDGFAENISVAQANAKEHKKQIAYFSCPRGAQLEDIRTFDFFSTTQQVVRALFELAKDDPDLHVVVKMKDMHISLQLDEMRQELHRIAGSEKGLPNVEFETGRMAAHEVIRQSDIVCAMQSTTVLEAAIAGKPVILPHFKEMREREGAEQVLMYREYYELFDVPDNPEHLKAIILDRLSRPEIKPVVMNSRKALFEEHVSPLNGGATQKSLDMIRETARRRRLVRMPEVARAQVVVSEA